MSDDPTRRQGTDPRAMATLFKGLPMVRLRCVANGDEVVYDRSRGHPTPAVLADLVCPRCKEVGMRLAEAPT